MNTTTDVPEPSRRIVALIGELESAGDPRVVAVARDLLQAVMELHGAGLERMLDLVSESGAAGHGIVDGFSRDELVSSLLVLYGLHPLPLETRVRRALDRARLHGGTAELLSVEEGVVRVRIQAASSSCGSSSGDLQASVEEIMQAAAPDVVRLVIEGGEERSAGGFVPIETLTGQRRDLHVVSLKGSES